MASESPAPHTHALPPAALSRLSEAALRHRRAMLVADASGRILWLNAQARASCDAAPTDLLGRPIAEVAAAARLRPESAARLQRALSRRRATRLRVERFLADGQPQSATLELQPTLAASGEPDGWLMQLEDAPADQRLQAMLGRAVLAAGLGSWHWDMASGRLHFNDRVATMLGYRPDQLAGDISTWSTLVHPDDRRAWQLALRAHLAQPANPCRCELRVRRPDGEWASVLSIGELVSRDAQGRPAEMVGLNIDLTEQSQMQAMLRHAASTDGLTQLPNRAAVFDHVQRAIDRAALQPEFGYAVLFMDFDRFKQINDTLGHAAGDELLRQIAQRLRSALRSSDTVRQGSSWQHSAGRIGGDEFVVVLEGVRSRDEAGVVATRLMAVLAEPYRLGDHVVHSSASIGIVTSEHAANDAYTVMRDADTAMYEAKRAGRGRWMLFDPAMHERLSRGVALEQDLRAALDRDELFVVFQPVVRLCGEGRPGVEALLRWRHPLRGLVPPSEFIAVAEDSGLIHPLGLWVLEQACRQFVAWQRTLGADAPGSLAVNLSARQLQSARLVEQVSDALARTGLAPSRLQLEVTESFAAQDEQARNRLRALKSLGLRIALDDFGTGYSSLACLHLLPVDTVKIDRSFVEHALSSAHHRALIEATIRVAQALGMDTVAEGIESPEQARLLAELHCTRGQGYLFGTPLEVPAAERWLRANAGHDPWPTAADPGTQHAA